MRTRGAWLDLIYGGVSKLRVAKVPQVSETGRDTDWGQKTGQMLRKQTSILIGKDRIWPAKYP